MFESVSWSPSISGPDAFWMKLIRFFCKYFGSTAETIFHWQFWNAQTFYQFFWSSRVIISLFVNFFMISVLCCPNFVLKWTTKLDRPLQCLEYVFKIRRKVFGDIQNIWNWDLSKCSNLIFTFIFFKNSVFPIFLRCNGIGLCYDCRPDCHCRYKVAVRR